MCWNAIYIYCTFSIATDNFFRLKLIWGKPDLVMVILTPGFLISSQIFIKTNYHHSWKFKIILSLPNTIIKYSVSKKK